MKKIRFFGCPEIFGDGQSWAYIGTTPDEIKESFKNIIGNPDVYWDDYIGEKIIKIELMTDEEVEALPML